MDCDWKDFTREAKCERQFSADSQAMVQTLPCFPSVARESRGIEFLPLIGVVIYFSALLEKLGFVFSFVKRNFSTHFCLFKRLQH